ncbi:hypothetical protein KAW64_04645 [bacterium]|nr:hypothetical protein [bacterium]
MRVLTLTLVGLLLCLVSLAPASEPATMSDLVGAMRDAADVSGLAERYLTVSEELEAELIVIEAAGIDSVSVEEVADALHRPGLMTLSRQRSHRYALDAPAAWEHTRVQEAIDRVSQIANVEMEELLSEKIDSGEIDDEAVDEMYKPLTDYQRSILSASLKRDLEKMRRFEKKFGPRAPRLNALEVGLNFVCQRLPGFYPTDEAGPGPFEIVASYDPAFLTVVEEKPELISTAGFGIRYYLFGDGWGEEEGLAGMLKPGYFSLGVLVAPEEDGALLWPWQGESRIGGFATWGNLKVAYIGGDEDRYMVSREFEAIPWLF